MSEEVTMNASSTRRTTTQGDDFGATSYRPYVAPRSVIIQRSVAYTGGSGGGGAGYARSAQSSKQYGMTFAMPPGGLTELSSSGIKSSREKEKKDLQDLNERFASYIEKVRFLEAQNSRLSGELENLKSRWGKETSQVKAMYQAELDEARRLLDETEKEKARLEIKTATLEDIMLELREQLDEANRPNEAIRAQIEKQNQQLSDYEGEINMLRRRVEALETEKERDKKQIATLTTSLNSARANLDDETLNHIDAENRRQTLEEELEFLKTIHEQELKELSALAYRDTTAENRDFWKNEMGSALREIQDMYDQKLDVMRSEIETSYNSKLQEFRTGATRQSMDTVTSKEESKRMRGQVTDLRDKLSGLEIRNNQLERELDQLRRQSNEIERGLEHENSELRSEIANTRAQMEGILLELQNIMGAKLSLELEIAAYRKLLEGEESRVGLRKMVDVWGIGGGRQDGGHFSLTGGDMSSRTRFQKSAIGPISIDECSADGKYVVLENTGHNEEYLQGWRITRTIDGEAKVEYYFPENTTLHAGDKMKIWCKGCKPDSASPTDIEAYVDSFGSGLDIVTKLLNPAEEDRATHIQTKEFSVVDGPNSSEAEH